MRKNILYITILLFSVSCSSENVKNINEHIVHKIENLNNYENIYLDSIANVKYIQLLKPNDQTYIGKIKKIISINDCIYISDGKNIFTYDMDGKCKSILNKMGKANDEYLRIYDFEVVDTNIYIIDRNLCKLLSYNSDGKCICTFKLNFYPKSIKMIDNSSMVICAENDIIDNEEKMKFHIYDTEKNKIVNSFCPIDIHKGKYMKHLWNNNYTVVNDSIFYYEPNDNTILHITKKKGVPYISFDFGSNEPPAEFYQKDYENVALFFYDFHTKQYASGVYWAIWNNSKTLFQFIHNKELKIALIDKLNHKTYISQYLYVNRDVKLDEIYTYNCCLYSYIYPNETTREEYSNNDIIVLIAELNNNYLN